jgi:diphthamide biosynthesis protein 3
MGAYYDEIEIEDMVWDEEKGVFHYPCPCGDRFEISRKQLANYEDIATCPSCSLIIRIIFDPVRNLPFYLQIFAKINCVRSQLDFEDESSDEEDGALAESKNQEQKDEEEEKFEDALENLHISDRPSMVTAAA